MERDKAAFICVKDSLDGAYPSLVLGINAARQGMETKIFYSFMGLNLVLKGGVDRAKFFSCRSDGRYSRHGVSGNRDDEKED